MNNLPSSLAFFVQRGSFRVSRTNKDNARPRTESLRVKTSCISGGLEFPKAQIVGEASHKALSFDLKK